MSTAHRHARRARLLAIFRDTLDDLNPTTRVADALADIEYTAPQSVVIAVGKAAPAMFAGARRYLDARALSHRHGVVIAPAALVHQLDGQLGAATVIGSAHPVPDQRSVDAARAALDAIRRAPPDARVLALISGGGSALMARPLTGLSLADKVAVTRALAEQGAAIEQLNVVRKHLSAIKGGKLALASPVPVTTLVSSDVVGDDLAMVASGPTLPDLSTAAEATAILDRFCATRSLPPAALDALARAADRDVSTLSASSSGRRADDRAKLVAGTRALLSSAVAACARARLDAQILAASIAGDVADTARLLARGVRQLSARADPTPLCLVAGGEPTIRLPRHRGVGGRAHHVALLLARDLAGVDGVSALCVGSDGMDGDTAAAGAIVDGSSWRELASVGVDGDRALRTCDAGRALAAIDASVVTGPTGVNHADLFVLLTETQPMSL